MANAYLKTIRQTVIQKLPLEGFTKKEKVEIYEMLEGNIINRIHLDILDELSEIKRHEFYILSEKQQPKKIQAFLEKELPHFSDLVVGATEKVITDFLSR